MVANYGVDVATRRGYSTAMFVLLNELSKIIVGLVYARDSGLGIINLRLARTGKDVVIVIQHNSSVHEWNPITHPPSILNDDGMFMQWNNFSWLHSTWPELSHSPFRAVVVGG